MRFAQGYFVAQTSVTDPRVDIDFVAQDVPVIDEGGRELLMRGGPSDRLEGAARRGCDAGIRLPSIQAAQVWFRSPDDSADRDLEMSVSTRVQGLVQGVE